MESSKPPKPAILISRQLGGIGDILMITPTVRAIKEQNPDTPIIFCTTYSYGNGALFDILKHNPHIHKLILPEELSKYTFKKVYNLTTAIETKMEINPYHPTGNRIDIFADISEVKLKDKSTVYIITPEEKGWAAKWISNHDTRKKIIGIQTQASTSKRAWPEEKCLLLAFKIVNTWKDTSVVLFYEGPVDLTGRSYTHIHPVWLPIRQVAALINASEVTIAPDSALLHIAGALDVKAVALFGSTPPISRTLYYPKVLPIQNSECRNCWYSRCYRNYECMNNITVDKVMEGIGSRLVNRKITPTIK
jgi:ADP-heptose:LPS heptosyltransferase